MKILIGTLLYTINESRWTHWGIRLAKTKSCIFMHSDLLHQQQLNLNKNIRCSCCDLTLTD